MLYSFILRSWNSPHRRLAHTLLSFCQILTALCGHTEIVCATGDLSRVRFVLHERGWLKKCKMWKVQVNKLLTTIFNTCHCKCASIMMILYMSCNRSVKHGYLPTRKTDLLRYSLPSGTCNSWADPKPCIRFSDDNSSKITPSNHSVCDKAVNNFLKSIRNANLSQATRTDYLITSKV